MKRYICAVFIIIILLSGCLTAGADDYIPKYIINDAGEAVVDDVLFDYAADVQDNARVFYEIFVGSFSDSDGDGIGDLRGIINRMDYLNDGDPESGLSLGVEGIWLTPVFSSGSYHKYDVIDFYSIDPQFGNEEDLCELIDLCHQRNVKLILDLPINHTSVDCRWFKNFVNAHIANNPGNQYYHFYSWINAADPVPAGRHFAHVKNTASDILYECNFSEEMPEPDFDQECVRETMLNVALHYVDLGVDGFRFDAAKYIYLGEDERSLSFWKWYIGELKKYKPNLYTVAEVWDGEGVIEQYIACTNCFNFTLSQADGLIAETAKAGNAGRFASYMEKYIRKLYGINKEAMPVLFVSNHDMDRAAGYLTEASGNMKTAASLYILSPGSPFIYYGEEIGLRGSRGGSSTDANRRLAMPWGDGDQVSDPPGSTYEESKQTPYTVTDQMRMGESLYNHYKKLIMIRKANPEIARGEYQALVFPESKLGGFICQWNGNSVAVLHNTTNRQLSVDLNSFADYAFETIVADAGAGTAVLDGSVLMLDGQTSVVIR